MGDVVGIDGGTVTPQGAPVEVVVALLKSALADAEAGKIRAIAIAAIGLADNFTVHSQTEEGYLKVLGAIEVLKADIVQFLVDGLKEANG